MTRLLAPLPAFLLFLPQAALAHAGHGDASGFGHGILHPVAGADHVLAMVAVGLLAGLRGGRAVWLLPATFLGMMAVGGALGAAGTALPYPEIGIGLSVVVFGLACLLRRSVPLAGLVGIVGLFAVFHGHAHGAEMPETASGLAYGLGFLVGTALLHAAGLALGLAAASRRVAPIAAPVMGGAVAAAGLALLVHAA